MDFEFETTRTGLEGLQRYRESYEGLGPDSSGQYVKFADVERFLDARAAAEKPTGDLTDEQIRDAVQGIYLSDFQDNPEGYDIAIARAAIAAHIARPAQAEPPRMSTDESREYLVQFMEQHFTDKTFHRYIRGDKTRASVLAGDFAWQMARALRMILVVPASQEGAHAALEEVRNQVLDVAAEAADSAYLAAQCSIERGEFSQPLRQTREAIEVAIRALKNTTCAERSVAADERAPVIAYAVESNIGGGLRAITKLTTIEADADRYVNAEQARYAGCERRKIELCDRAAIASPAVSQQAVPSVEQLTRMLDTAERGWQCPMCGLNYPHRHTPNEIIIFRNGIKYAARSQEHARAHDQGAAQDAGHDAGGACAGGGAGAHECNEHRAGEPDADRRDGGQDGGSAGVSDRGEVRAPVGAPAVSQMDGAAVDLEAADHALGEVGEALAKAGYDNPNESLASSIRALAAERDGLRSASATASVSEWITCPRCKGQHGGVGPDGVENDCSKCENGMVRTTAPSREAAQQIKTWQERNPSLDDSMIPGDVLDELDDLRAAIASPAVPKGYKLVPLEPTQEMRTAGYMRNLELGSGKRNPEETYKAMLAASPAVSQMDASEAPPKMKDVFAHLLSIQRAEAEAGDAYMLGLYNGMAMMCANIDGDLDWEPMTKPATQQAVSQMDVAAEQDTCTLAMDQIATEHAHGLAMELECVLYDYSGKWYDSATAKLSAYRDAVNAIHERESPTHMGEPLLPEPASATATTASASTHTRTVVCSDSTVYVCPERDIECGQREDRWCAKCPKRRAQARWR